MCSWLLIQLWCWRVPLHHLMDVSVCNNQLQFEMCDVNCEYCKVLKICPPFTHYFMVKVGRGIYSIFSCVYVPSPVPCNTTIRAFWKNSSSTKHVLHEICNTFVDTKPRGIKATCIVVVKGTTPHKLAFPVQATKSWWWLANEAIVILHAPFYKQDQQWSWTKSSLNAKSQCGVFSWGQNTYVGILGLKRRKAFAQREWFLWKMLLCRKCKARNRIYKQWS